MNPIQTGIAVALALGVIAIFFIFPGLSPLSSPQTSQTASSTALQMNTQNASTTMSETNPTKLEAVDETIGTGATAQSGDQVTVNYVGMLTNGTVFDASANHGTQGFTFTLGAHMVIQGWDLGIVGMKEGGKRKLIIPAALAYGSQSPAASIPANSTLVFEVQLVKVQRATK